MALSRSRRVGARTDYWPGFVDAMATLLLVIFFLSQEISGRDTVLNRLNLQIAELTELLALERAGNRSLDEQLASLRDSLASSEAEQARLQGILESQSADSASTGGQLSTLQQELTEEQQVSQRALAQVELLNQQISSLRRQIAALERALDASELEDQESKTRIADLGRRLNIAQKVQELSRYRSDFFGRLREILSQRSDIRVVGDRFVFQSEVLFPSGAETINPAGEQELQKLAEAVKELEGEIPPEINWVIRVDGHTDSRPINSARFRSNWELSAARAISVVQYLISQGVSPNHLVAAGFADNYPLQEGDTEEAYRANRRIELKLTER